ncbi:hypothetical protein EVAR_40754_1 [Eumeta japonica]|uniref:Uncharacterized protein n=1 Tax=Eumeta variegata TaxID=151549 RepID=A0A4C1X3E2_EUMVA|nr:hypothetical protein EVAR_40754_1 [Eumeta japonica]
MASPPSTSSDACGAVATAEKTIFRVPHLERNPEFYWYSPVFFILTDKQAYEAHRACGYRRPWTSAILKKWLARRLPFSRVVSAAIGRAVYTGREKPPRVNRPDGSVNTPGSFGA